MRVLVTFRHVDPSPALREYADHKLQRVQKYVRRVSDAHVVLSVAKRRHSAEVTLQAGGSTVKATEVTDNLYAAIDLAMDKIERQVKKAVAKRKDRKHQGRAVEPRVEKPSRAPKSVVRTERVAVKPMSIDEAVMQLDLMKHDFLLFKNAATETVSVVYRRKDGKYGLIEPEVS